jgi:hypothetical protein
MENTNEDKRSKESKESKESNELNEKKSEIHKWYTDRLQMLNNYVIDGNITDNNLQIKIGVFKKEDNNKDIPIEFSKDCLSKGLGEKTWIEYTNNFAKSRLGKSIFNASINEQKPPINLFNAIKNINKTELKKLINKESDLDTLSFEEITNSLELVLMNAVRYYYVHSLLSEIIEKKVPSETKLPCIIISTGSNDAGSDYDLGLYICSGIVSEVVESFYDTIIKHWNKSSDKLFDTNIYTSAYLIPFNSIKGTECYNIMKILNETSIISYNYATFIKLYCENEYQLAYALYHLIETTPIEHMEDTLSLFDEIMDKVSASKNSRSKLFNNIVNVIADMMHYSKKYESTQENSKENSHENTHAINQECKNITTTMKNSVDFQTLHGLIKCIDNNKKRKLYDFYTKILYNKLKESINDEDLKKQSVIDEKMLLICDLIAKINICMPETYYSYGALMMGVAIGQMKINVINDNTPSVVYACSLLEDYAFIMEKYDQFIQSKSDDNIVNINYIGKTAKYAYRIIHSLYLLKCKFTNHKCTNDIIQNIKFKESNIKDLKLANEVLKLKVFKDTPNDEEAIRIYRNIVNKKKEKPESKETERTEEKPKSKETPGEIPIKFLTFLEWLDNKIRETNENIVYGGSYIYAIAKKYKNDYLKLK